MKVDRCLKAVDDRDDSQGRNLLENININIKYYIKILILNISEIKM